MAQKKRKKRKQPKTHPVLGLILAVVFLVTLPLVLMKLKEQPSPLPEMNPYSAEDFALKDGFMTCLTADSALGIDVSYYQGEIDWQQVRQAGVEFAFIRIGYRRAADGVLGEDQLAHANLQGASEAGIRVGAYFFSQATSKEEAREEAEYALDLLQDYPLDLPLVYDWETVEGSDRTAGMTPQLLTDCIETFCSTVEWAGYDTMVYFNRELSRTLLDVQSLNGRPVWFAMYDTYPDAPCKPDYWQYTDQGTVPGIEGYVDLNLFLA